VDEKDWSVFSSLLIKEISKKSTFLVKGEVRLFMPEEDEEKELTF
tara:strand:+ start:61 stop:195 length:135 start_codon:yes stop_codon:yes gene_type:complete